MYFRSAILPPAIILLSLIAIPHAQAQLDFSISPTPIGSGARAAGMADAFTAIADDATAASWNPAGLVQLEEPELSIVGEFIELRDSIDANAPGVDNNRDFTVSTSNLNFASLTYPLPRLVAGRNAVISLTYQQRFDFDRELDVDQNIFASRTFMVGGDTLTTTTDQDFEYTFEQDGKLSVLSPAIAIELTETLSIGAAVNFWRPSFLDSGNSGWDQRITNHTQGTTITVNEANGEQTILETNETFVSDESYSDFKGENFTLGLLWNPHPKWNIALRYDTGFEGSMKYKVTERRSNPFFGDMVTIEQRKMKVPDTWTLGVANRVNDRLTLSLQASYTDWDDFYITEGDGTRISLVDGTDIDNPITKTDLDPTVSLRFGAEYVLIPKNLSENLDYLWILRGGLIWDQEPASGRSTFDPNSKGDGNPDNFYGFATGVGLQVKQRVNIDLAYQFRYGDDVKQDRVRGLDGFKEDLVQHRVILSTIIYF